MRLLATDVHRQIMDINDVTFKINGAVEKLQKVHEVQILNYLKATDLKIGLLVNFTFPKAEIKRFIL